MTSDSPLSRILPLWGVCRDIIRWPATPFPLELHLWATMEEDYKHTRIHYLYYGPSSTKRTYL
jgi:hypothetical protein